MYMYVCKKVEYDSFYYIVICHSEISVHDVT